MTTVAGLGQYLKAFTSKIPQYLPQELPIGPDGQLLRDGEVETVSFFLPGIRDVR